MCREVRISELAEKFWSDAMADFQKDPAFENNFSKSVGILNYCHDESRLTRERNMADIQDRQIRFDVSFE